MTSAPFDPREAFVRLVEIPHLLAVIEAASEVGDKELVTSGYERIRDWLVTYAEADLRLLMGEYLARRHGSPQSALDAAGVLASARLFRQQRDNARALMQLYRRHLQRNLHPGGAVELLVLVGTLLEQREANPRYTLSRDQWEQLAQLYPRALGAVQQENAL